MRTFAIGAVSVLLCSCGAQDRTTPIATPPRVTSQVESKDAALASPIVARAARIAKAIAALRGWQNDLAIAYEIADLPRVRQAIAADLYAQTPAETLQAQTRFLASFGWVPDDFQLSDAITRTFSPEILGLYCTTWRRVLVASNVPPSSLDSVLRHELVHAFQDRYFHLTQQVHWAQNRSDSIAAVHSLAEGEAVCITRALEDPSGRGCLDADDSDEDRVFSAGISRLPPIIQYSMLSPYADGVHFVSRLLREGGWSRVDLAWREGVTSTRELLGEVSPNRAELEPPSAPPGFSDCKVELVDILGTQGLASVLYDGADPSRARSLAATLLGDRAAAWRCQQGCASAWHLRTDASRRADAMGEALRGNLRILPSTESKPAGCGHTQLGVLSLVQDAHDIVITSVHNCDSLESNFATKSCEFAAKWAGQLISQRAP